MRFNAFMKSIHQQTLHRPHTLANTRWDIIPHKISLSSVVYITPCRPSMEWLKRTGAEGSHFLICLLIVNSLVGKAFTNIYAQLDLIQANIYFLYLSLKLPC